MISETISPGIRISVDCCLRSSVSFSTQFFEIIAVLTDHCKILCIVNKQSHQLKVIRKLGNTYQLKVKFRVRMYTLTEIESTFLTSCLLTYDKGQFYSRTKVGRRSFHKLEMLRQIKHFDFFWKHLCGNNLSSAWNNSKILIGWERSLRRIEDIKLH